MAESDPIFLYITEPWQIWGLSGSPHYYEDSVKP
jgi:hypothetical protein